jgi:photosystem II stability/assembly factor-like uncharacterized protein
MKNVLAQAIFVVACLCMSITAMANTVRMESLNWVQFGPHGELLVAGSMGAMLSVDGGKTWTSPVRALGGAPDDPSLSVQQMAKKRNLTWPGLQWPFGVRSAVDDQGRIYRCSRNNVSVEYSDNHGKDWIRAIVLTDNVEESAYPCHIVSMVANVPYVLSDRSIYWSEDRGQHWKRNHHALDVPRGSDPLRLIKLFGDSNGVLYVNHKLPWTQTDQYIKIQRSKDQGASWEPLFFNLPREQAIGTVVLLQIHKDALYFVTQAGLREPTSLYRSTDARTATKLLDIPSAPLLYVGLRFFDIGPHGELAVVGNQSLFVSKDQGKTWKTIGKDTLWKGPWLSHT